MKRERLYFLFLAVFVLGLIFFSALSSAYDREVDVFPGDQLTAIKVTNVGTGETSFSKTVDYTAKPGDRVFVYSNSPGGTYVWGDAVVGHCWETVPPKSLYVVLNMKVMDLQTGMSKSYSSGSYSGDAEGVSENLEGGAYSDAIYQCSVHFYTFDRMEITSLFNDPSSTSNVVEKETTKTLEFKVSQDGEGSIGYTNPTIGVEPNSDCVKLTPSKKGSAMFVSAEEAGGLIAKNGKYVNLIVGCGSVDCYKIQKTECDFDKTREIKIKGASRAGILDGNVIDAYEDTGNEKCNSNFYPISCGGLNEFDCGQAYSATSSGEYYNCQYSDGKCRLGDSLGKTKCFPQLGKSAVSYSMGYFNDRETCTKNSDAICSGGLLDACNLMADSKYCDIKQNGPGWIYSVFAGSNILCDLSGGACQGTESSTVCAKLPSECEQYERRCDQSEVCTPGKFANTLQILVGGQIRTLAGEFKSDAKGQSGQYYKLIEDGKTFEVVYYSNQVNRWADTASTNLTMVSLPNQGFNDASSYFPCHLKVGKYSVAANGLNVGAPNVGFEIISDPCTPDPCKCKDVCEDGYKKRVIAQVQASVINKDNMGLLIRDNDWTSKKYTSLDNFFPGGDKVFLDLGTTPAIKYSSGKTFERKCEAPCPTLEESPRGNPDTTLFEMENGKIKSGGSTGKFRIMTNPCKESCSGKCEYKTLRTKIDVQIDGGEIRTFTRKEMKVGRSIKYEDGQGGSILYLYNNPEVPNSEPDRAAILIKKDGKEYDAELPCQPVKDLQYDLETNEIVKSGIERLDSIKSIKIKIVSDPCPDYTLVPRSQKYVYISWFPGLFGADVGESIYLLNFLKQSLGSNGWVHDMRGWGTGQEYKQYLIENINPGDIYVLGGWSSGGPAAYDHLTASIRYFYEMWGQNVPVTAIGVFRFDPTGADINENPKGIWIDAQPLIHSVENVFSNEKGTFLPLVGHAERNHFNKEIAIDLKKEVDHWGVSTTRVKNLFSDYIGYLRGINPRPESSPDPYATGPVVETPVKDIVVAIVDPLPQEYERNFSIEKEILGMKLRSATREMMDSKEYRDEITASLQNQLVGILNSDDSWAVSSTDCSSGVVCGSDSSNTINSEVLGSSEQINDSVPVDSLGGGIA